MTPAERAKLILAIRAQDDPCQQMQMTPTQQAANDCRARYIAVRGQNRGGKTAWAAKKLATIARRLPDCKTTSVNGVYVVFAPSRSQLADPWGKKLLQSSELMGALFDKPFLPDYEIANVRYSPGEERPVRFIELKNGNKIIFCVSGDKNVWKRIEGKGMILGIVFDESAGTEQLLTEALTRLLDAHSNETVKKEAGGGWIIWAATQTKKSAAFERYLAICQSNDPLYDDYAAFSLQPGENPAILSEEREKMALIMSEDDYNIRMLGHGSTAAAMALYPQWDDNRNLVADADYEVGIDDNLWVGYDPGSHYTGIMIAAVNKLYPHRLNVVKVWQPQRSTIEADVKLVRDWLGGRSLTGWVYDPAARKVDKVGQSVLGILHKLINTKGYDIRIHRGLMMGRNRYEDTVPLMRRYLACQPGDAGYPTNLICNKSPESGCMLLRWQIQNCAFTEHGFDLKEDQIQKGNDHCSDAARYLVSRQPTWQDWGRNPKLWGEGTHGSDPDQTVKFADARVLGDATTPGNTAEPQLTPGQRFAHKRAKLRMKQKKAKLRFR